MPDRKNLDGDLVPEGYKDNLTPDMQRALRELWRRFFDLYEMNKERSAELDRKGGPQAAGTAPSQPANEKDVGKDIPKDDKAKEEAKKAEEMKEMNKFIDIYGGPYLHRACWEFCLHDNPDASMLRFLRARKWDVDRALAMLAAALLFRFQKDVTGIIFKGEDGLKDVPGFLNQFRRGISYIKGNSGKPGEHPMYFIHVARHFTSAQKHEVLQQFVLLAMENARLLTTPPFEKAVVIFDMGGFGLKNMDWQCVLFLVKCLEAYYPESLQRIYVHNAPWIFKGIWQVLQPMLDPVVRDKIKFSSKAAEIKDYAPTEKLRKAMGGTMDWDWDYLEPDPKENDCLKDVETREAMKKEYDDLAIEFERVTRQWIAAGDTDDASPELTYRRNVLSKQLRLTALRMYKYTRARNVYQRQGILKEDGSFTWEYPQLNGAPIVQTVNDRHNIPALRQWLIENNEDPLDDTVCGRFGYCGTETGGLGAAGKAKKGSSRSAAAAGGAAAAAATAAGAAGAGAALRKRGEAPEPKSRLATNGSNGGDYDDAPAAAASRRKPPSRQPSQQSRPAPPAEDEYYDEPEPQRQPEPVRAARRQPEEQRRDEEPQQQSYTGAAIGAVSGAAAAVTGAAAGAASYLRGSNGSGEHQQEDYRQPQSQRSQPALNQQYRNQPGPEQELDDGQDDDEEDEEDFDDDDSAFSDESLTPETVVAPYYMGQKPPTAAQVKIDDNDCREDLAAVREAMSLFLNSRMKEAEDICAKGADHRLYRAVGMSLINAVKSIMTFEPRDFETAILCCKHSMHIAGLLRKKQGTVNKMFGSSKQSQYKNMTLVQQHAELVYAESQLLKSLLGIFYAGDSLAFVKQALGLRNAYFMCRELFKFVEFCDGEAEEAQISNRKAAVSVDQDFRSGVYFCNGASSLVLSLLPEKALKFMEGMGFSGDRRFALDLFSRAGGWTKARPLPTISADEEGVRRPLSDIAILVYHLVISAYVPITDVDFEYADKILSWNLVRFPDGIFFLYFSARLYAAQALPEKAIEYYRNALEAQSQYKQLHHLIYWDLSLTYLATCDFARAYECYDVLSRESNWSKAIYQYAKAAMLYETGMDDRAKSATIMRTVGKLTKKIAGRQIPFEKFVMLKAKKYVAQGNHLPLCGLEFSYLWHCLTHAPVFLLVESTLPRIDTLLDELLEYSEPSSYPGGASAYYSAAGVAWFLRGVALRFVAYPQPHTLVRLPSDDSIGPLEEITADAAQSFQKVFQLADKLDATDRYLCYFAHYELGRLHACMGNEAAAKAEYRKVLSGKSLEAKGKGLGGAKASYLLSSMCQVRTHAALETLRIQKNRSRSSFFSGGSDAGSLAGGSSIGGSLSSRASLASGSMTSRSSATRATSMSSRSGDNVSIKSGNRSRSGSAAPTDYTK